MQWHILVVIYMQGHMTYIVAYLYAGAYISGDEL